MHQVDSQSSIPLPGALGVSGVLSSLCPTCEGACCGGGLRVLINSLDLKHNHHVALVYVSVLTGQCEHCTVAHRLDFPLHALLSFAHCLEVVLGFCALA